jgi:hypothetical protein
MNEITQSTDHPDASPPAATMENAMQSHTPDRVALVFGLLFTTVAAVSIADLTDVADVSGAVVAGAVLVFGALLVVAVTISSALSERSEPSPG